MKNQKNKGFSLGEILIALTIIGIIGTMTVPSLMLHTEQKEFSVGLKKAFLTINDAIKKEYAEAYLDLRAYSNNVDVAQNLLKPKLNVIDGPSAMTVTNNSTYTSGCNGTKSNVLTTADGMIYCVYSHTVGNSNCDKNGTQVCGYILVDVNGEKKPNKLVESTGKATDIYLFKVYSNRIEADGDKAKKILGET